jgi:hypothetical protein
MIRIIVVFFACLLLVSAQETRESLPELQVSIGVEQVSPGIEGMSRKLAVIAVTIVNPGDSPRTVVVGSNYNNGAHWNVTANLMNRDGKVVALTHLPQAVAITGYAGPLFVGIAAHGSFRALLDARDFEEAAGDGSANLSEVMGGSGRQLQIVIHCGGDAFPEYSTAANSWKGDLVSGWLRL